MFYFKRSVIMPAIIMLFWCKLTFAAAYVPDRGHGMAIIGANAYAAQTEFQKNKSTTSFGEDGKFTKRELYYYLAHAISNDWAIIASGAILNKLSYENDFDEKNFTGPGDQYLGARYFHKKDQWGAGALQLGVSFPAYSNAANPAPGNRQSDLEIRYLRDHFQIMGPSFLSWEIAYRYRSSSPSDQLRADLNFGKNLKQWLPMVHVNYIKGLRNQSAQDSSVNPNTASDFDLVKAGISIAYRYSGQDSVQLGFMEDILGRNTGKGRGIFLAWWKGY